MMTSRQKEIYNKVIKYMRSSTVGLPTNMALATLGVTRAAVRHNFGSLTELLNIAKEKNPDLYARCIERMNNNKLREQYLDQIAELTLKLNRYPSLRDLESIGFTREKIKHHFSSVSNLPLIIKKNRPHILKDLLTIRTKVDSNSNIQLDDYDQFIISTVVSGCKVDTDIYRAIETWKEVNTGAAIYQPIADPARRSQGQDMFFDPILRDEYFLTEDTSLSNTVHLKALLISAKQLRPDTGLRGIVDRFGLNIIASPKQTLSPLANIGENPGYIYAPGTITRANYTTDMYMSNRTAYISHVQHTLGAGIVKILGPNKYLFTNINFLSDGSFTHFGTNYSKKGVEGPVDTEYMVIGDLHGVERDPHAFENLKEMIRFFKPKELFLNDSFSGVSINVHELSNNITRYLTSMFTVKSLEQEAYDYKEMLDNLRQICNSKLFIVRGNHDLFLERWVDKGYYTKDQQNLKLGHEMALHMMNHPGVPLTWFLYKKVGGNVDANKVQFLDELDSVRRHGVECGQHTHIGAQGKRSPSLRQCVEILGPCNKTHSHTSQIVPGGGIAAGTMTGIGRNRPAYANKGTNMWSQSCIVGYADGSRQLVHLVNGEFLTF